MTNTSRNSFDHFAVQLREPLRRRALRIVGDAAESEDIVQETLLAVWQRWHAQTIDDPMAYALRAVTLNAIKRQTRRRNHLSLNDVPVPQRSEQSLNAEDLEAAIAQLPLTQQTVIRLRFYLGLSFAEISRQLRISTNTAASRTRYALNKLRNRLKEVDDE